MIRDPHARGAALAAFHGRLEVSLWRDLEESGVLGASSDGARGRAREEWELLALAACVRGLVAAGGFNVETVEAVDALHAAVGSSWDREPGARARRARAAERHAEYGRVGQEAEAAGAPHVASRIGHACARHIAGPGAPPALAELLGSLYDALAEGAAESVRRGGEIPAPAAARGAER